MEQKTISKMHDLATDLSLQLARFITDQEELINVVICKGYKLANIYVESGDNARPMALVIAYEKKGKDTNIETYRFNFALDSFLSRNYGI